MNKVATKTVAAAPAPAKAVAAAPAPAKAVAVAVEAKAVAKVEAKAQANADTDAVWVRTKSGVARRYRAGLAFSAEPIKLDADELSQEQLAAIEADPLLVVVDAPAGEPVANAESGKEAE